MRKVFPQLSIDWLCRWLHGLNFTHPAFGIDQHVFRGVRSRLDAVAEMNTIGFPLAIEWTRKTLPSVRLLRLKALS